jgi:hypothetical protein
LQNPKRILQFAIEVVSFLDDTWIPTSYSQTKSDIFGKFWHITTDDVDRSNPHGCDNILGSLNFHSIYSISTIDPTLLMARDLACLCPPCVMEEWETCKLALMFSHGGWLNSNPAKPSRWESKCKSLKSSGSLEEILKNFLICCKLKTTL